VDNVLELWNRLPADKAADEILPCCGSKVWARRIAEKRPLPDEASLLAASDLAWRSLSQSDWMEALATHPPIGEKSPSAARSATWSSQEQRGIADADDAIKIALAEGNRQYERQFGHVFIICATGKSAAEMLLVLRTRLQNDPAAELRETAEQLRQITQIRLRKWLTA